QELGLTGQQGAIVPVSNERHLTLKTEVVDAMKEGRFHIWSVTSATEAIELLTGVPAGEADAEGHYPADSVFGRVMAQLERFDQALTERGIDRRGSRLA
ncbi:MAG: ATP-dependent protease, partial [Rhodospirillaceae bacterium]|nr:ATP-dependent protease [Rhodospirillaceae bacterium]